MPKLPPIRLHPEFNFRDTPDFCGWLRKYEATIIAMGIEYGIKPYRARKLQNINAQRFRNTRFVSHWR